MGLQWLLLTSLLDLVPDASALQALRGDEAEVVAAWQRRETEIGQLQQQVAGQDQRVAAAEASVVDKKVGGGQQAWWGVGLALGVRVLLVG